MRAVRNTSDGVRLVEVPRPEGPGVVVRPTAVGICGSDLHIVGLGPSPMTIGHEIGGLYEGRAVAIQPFVPCGVCPSCRLGNEHLCEVAEHAFHGVSRDGGMADEVLVDPRSIVELPTGVSAADAWLVEPVAVAVHAVNAGPVDAGSRVAVIGAGTIGQVTGAVAQAAGADVDVAARYPTQVECAERLGMRVGLRGGYDVVFDAAGTESSLAAAIAAVRPAGTVVMPALFWSDVPFPGLALGTREVRLVPAFLYGNHGGARETDIAAALLGRLPDLAPSIVSHRFPLERAAEAFAVAADRNSGALKVVLDVHA